MKQYRAYLKDCYQQPFPDYDQLLTTTTTTKHYIELAIVRRENKQVNNDNCCMAETLIPIALKEILKSECQPGRRVLIEGEPGIGKSTLVWELCHKWEELDSDKQYELVILVQLREKKAQEARCLEDLLPCDGTTNIQKLMAAIGRGKDVLIVCDGFDELPDKQRQEGSVYIDLIKGRLLPEATIIVTSRPSVSAFLWSLCQHNTDRYLQVKGFTTVGIKQFAKSVFSGDILEGFWSYIISDPSMYSMMYIPLYVVIVALIYQNSYDTPFATTMTQLFDALTCALICRHLRLSYKFLEFHVTSLQRMKDINKLPSLVAQQIVVLAKMAYEGMLNQTYIFTELSEDFEGLGILKKITSPNVCTGCGSSYTFLHLTLQEYMAALYSSVIVQTSELYSSHQIPGFKQNDVMRFVAGICSHSEYCDQPFYHDLVRIISENTSQHSLLLVHCAYECPGIMHDVKMGYSSDDVVLVEPVLNFDWYVTGYCISHFDVRWGLSIHKVIKDSAINLLVEGIRSSPVTIGSIQEMKISFNRPTSLSISQIFNKLKGFCQLRSLELSTSSDATRHDALKSHGYGELWGLELGISSDPTEGDALVMQQLIEPGSSLRSLKFWGSPILIPILLAQSSLKELTIKNEHNHEKLYLSQKNTNLKKLAMTCALLLPLAKLLPNYTPSLTCLIINNSIVYADDLPVFTELIQSHPTLEVLEIESYSPGKGSKANLVQLVKTAASSQLKKLLFSQYDYRLILPDIQEQYRHVLGELP